MKNVDLKWIPLPTIQQLGPPRGLKDFQVGWFWNLFWASLRTESVGYLPLSDDLWMLAGALTRERWDANSSAVLAAFEILELAGHRRLLYFPPLKVIIDEQMERMKKKKGFPSPVEDIHNFNSHSQMSGNLSLSLFDFDVGSKDEKRKENQRAEIKCHKCQDTGIHASISKPSIREWCNCAAGQQFGS